MPTAGPATPIQSCLNRLAAGDPAARDDLIRHSRDRLRGMAHDLLARNPRLRRWVESEDILQDALIRLDRAIRDVPLATTAHFLAVAGRNIRWRLLDLARHYYGAEGPAARHATPPPGSDPDPADARAGDPAALAELGELNARIDGLPAEEREAVELVYYLGLSQAEAAAHLGVSERTVRRRRLRAEAILGRLLGAGPSG